MGVKGKKHKFTSDVDIFAKDADNFKSKAYIWTAIKLPKKQSSKGNKEVFVCFCFFDVCYIRLL